MEDLRISVRISYDDKNKKYSLVNRKDGYQNKNITAKATSNISLPIQDGLSNSTTLSIQGTNNFTDTFDQMSYAHGHKKSFGYDNLVSNHCSQQ